MLLIFFSCNKEIDVPNEEANQLFGSWKLKNISGGFSGVGTPVTDEERVEFTSNGISKWYVNGKKKATIKFTLVQNGNQLEIHYKNSSKMNDKVIFIENQLHLYPIDCSDCFMYTYLKD